MATPQEQRNTEHGKILLSWKFPEYAKFRRTRGWYVAMSLLGVALIVWSVFDRNPLFAIIVIIAWAVIFFRSRLEPLMLTAIVTGDGVQIGRDFYPYDELAKFWVIYKPPEVKTLYLKFKSALRPILGISLEDADPVKLRAELKRFLTEDLEQEEEPASDSYGRMLKI